MKRIKQIIEALRVLSRTPSATIAKAADNVLMVAGGDGRDGKTTSDEDFNLIKNILAAVVDLAADMEKPAKQADGEAAK